MKPIRWELGSYMYANNKWLPGAFFMVWGVALALIWAREVIAYGVRLLLPQKPYLLPRKPYLALPAPSDAFAPFPIQEPEGEAAASALDGSAPAP